MANELLSAVLTLAWRASYAMILTSDPDYRELNRLQIQRGLGHIMMNLEALGDLSEIVPPEEPLSKTQVN